MTRRNSANATDTGTLPERIWVEVGLLDAHPDNPRLGLDDELVEYLTATMRREGRFDSAYPLLVRPLPGGRYQILDGHHRHPSAVAAGLTHVLCTVRDVDDAEAMMILVEANQQNGLDPLALGIHAFKYVTKSVGGKGKKGGLTAYASRLGKTKAYLSHLASAGEVAESAKGCSQLHAFAGKAMHLYAISKADRRAWPLLARYLVANGRARGNGHASGNGQTAGWTVDDVESRVSTVRRFEIEPAWESVFLPYEAVIERYLGTSEFSPDTVKKLCAEASATEELIRQYEGRISVPHFLGECHAWLRAGQGADSWDLRQLIKYRLALAERLSEESKENVWLQGDWRQFVPGWADGKISLVLTDPPYGIDFQSDFRLDRRQARRHEPIENDQHQAAQEVQEALTALVPKLADDAHVFVFCHWQTEPAFRAAVEAAGLTLRGSLVWAKNSTGMGDPNTTFAPKHERILHAVKGSPILFEREADVLSYDRVVSDRHPTEKPVTLLRRLIELTTVPGNVVVDPFGGVASTMIAAKECDRHYWGCELKEEYWAAGKSRLDEAAAAMLEQEVD